MAILITGGAGYIGSYVIDELYKEYEVIVLDNFSNSSLLNFNQDKAKLYIGSVLDMSMLETIFKNHTINKVIHLAAFKSVPNSMENPLEYYENNVVGLINVLKICNKYNCKDILFTSSACVYDIKDNPLNEFDILKSNNVYGDTKIICENILKNESTFNSTILRLFNVVGGEDKATGNSTNLIPSIKRSIEKHEPFYLYGNCIRDYISVYDVAKVIHHLLTKQKHLQIYNVGTGIGHTTEEIVFAYEQLFNVKINTIKKDSRTGDTNITVSDNSLLLQNIDFSLKTNLIDILQ